MTIRLATYLGDQGIAIHNCEMKEWQKKIRDLEPKVISSAFAEAASRFHQAIADRLVPSKEKP